MRPDGAPNGASVSLAAKGVDGLLRVVLVLWIFVRVAFFTALWLAVLLLAYIGYFTLSFVFMLVALTLVSALGAHRHISRWLRLSQR